MWCYEVAKVGFVCAVVRVFKVVVRVLYIVHHPEQLSNYIEKKNKKKLNATSQHIAEPYSLTLCQ